MEKKKRPITLQVATKCKSPPFFPDVLSFLSSCVLLRRKYCIGIEVGNTPFSFYALIILERNKFKTIMYNNRSVKMRQLDFYFPNRYTEKQKLFAR